MHGEMEMWQQAASVICGVVRCFLCVFERGECVECCGVCGGGDMGYFVLVLRAFLGLFLLAILAAVRRLSHILSQSTFALLIGHI